MKKRPSPALWSKIKPLTRNMRKEPTHAEAILWQTLRGKQVGGVRFRRQHAIGRYIVDFYCESAKLVVEVDGKIHEQQTDEDAARTEYLSALGLQVIRFKNEDVVNQLTDVIDVIRQHLKES